MVIYYLVLIDVAKSMTTSRSTFGIIAQLHNFIEGSSKRHAVFKLFKEDKWKSFSEETIRYSLVLQSRSFESTKVTTRGSKINIGRDCWQWSHRKWKCWVAFEQKSTFDFVFTLIILEEIFTFINILSKYLQKVEIANVTTQCNRLLLRLPSLNVRGMPQRRLVGYPVEFLPTHGEETSSELKHLNVTLHKLLSPRWTRLRSP